jgi:putative alpha-1,2-mannosidase
MTQSSGLANPMQSLGSADGVARAMTIINRHLVYVFSLISTLVLFLCSCSTSTKDPVDYVDPFIGTDFFGHTFPGATLPYGMVQLSPDHDVNGWTYAAGYAYPDSSIIGFSHTHFSGVGMTTGGDILVMPTVGDKIQTSAGSKDNPDSGYRSRYDKKDESASPGYYSVFLKGQPYQSRTHCHQARRGTPLYFS